MDVLMAVVTGALFAAGFYLLLRRHVFPVVIGFVILSHAVNLLLLTAGGLKRGAAPIVAEKAAGAEPLATADPLPQALVLTAIVIGLGVQAFVLVLVYRIVRAQHSPDLARARTSEEEGRR